jgi:hypothetical protein
MTFSAVRTLGFSLFVSLSLGACASAEASKDDVVDVEAADLTSAADLKLFQAALVGISSSGSEGDPVPYRAIVVSLKAGDTWNAETLAARIGAKLPEVRSAGATYGYQGFTTGRAMTKFWKDETTVPADASDPVEAKARAERMKGLKVLCAQKLTNVTSMVVGVRSDANVPSSIENGAVAPLIVGKLANGKLIVLYGIDIWT